MIVALAAREARVAEQPQVEQRLRGAALLDDERGQRDRGERAGGEHRGGRPALRRRLDDRPDERDQARRRRAPRRSSRCAARPGRATPGRRRARRRARATHSGTLTMKIEPHQKWSSRTPPTTGPSATPRPAVAAQMPIAIARSRASVKTLTSSESVAGMMNAAPGAHDRAGGDQPVDAARVGGGRRGERRTPRARRAACGGARSDRRARRPAAAARRTRACTRRPPTAAR